MTVHETITVHARHLEPAPVPQYGDADVPPWEAWRIHHDNRTQTNTAAFGEAYSQASPLCNCGQLDGTVARHLALRRASTAWRSVRPRARPVGA